MPHARCIYNTPKDPMPGMEYRCMGCQQTWYFNGYSKGSQVWHLIAPSPVENTSPVEA